MDKAAADELLALLEEPFEEEDETPALPSNNNSNEVKLIDDEDIFKPKSTSECGSTPRIGKTITIKDLFGDDISDDDDEYLTASGKDIKHQLKNSKGGFGFSNVGARKNPWKSRSSDIDVSVDPLSGIRVINPLISSFELKSHIADKKFIKLSQMKRHVNVKTNEISGDWVTVGVVTSKTTQNSKASGKMFSILKLSDMTNIDDYVSLFLFGECQATHWKIMVGSVIALLNPVFMTQKTDSKYKSSKHELCSIKLDNPVKLLMVGESKDMSRCKAVTKSGEVCNAVTNASISIYCNFHITQDYKKLASKRPELRATYSGIIPRGIAPKTEQELKEEFQTSPSFSCALLGPQSKKALSKIQESAVAEKSSEQAAEASEGVDKKDEADKSATSDKRKRVRDANDLRQKMEQRMIKEAVSAPLTLAARNFAIAANVKSTSSSSNSKKGVNINDFKCANDILLNIKTPTRIIATARRPILGAGLRKGDVIDLISGKRHDQAAAAAKLKAAAVMKKKTSDDLLVDPKTRKKRTLNSILQRVESTIINEGKTEEQDLKEKMAVKKRRLEEIDKAIKRKSKHEFEVDILERKEDEIYFNKLEKRETIEEKMGTIMSFECKVVTCSECKYTDFSQSEICKKKNHQIKRHRATKKFFKCKECKTKTFTFDQIIPTKPCTKCGSKSYEKCSMYNIKQGPKLESEKLQVRGEEIKFLNSLK